MTTITGRLLAAAGAAALLLSGCGQSGSGTGAAPSDERLQVLAAFYPLQFVAQEVAGQAAEVGSLTPPGAEPHDIELTAQQVAAISEADLVLYVKGFQPAVDQAVEQAGGDRALDVSADLDLLAGSEHADEGGSDPHVWLNPLNMARISSSVAQRLSLLHGRDAATFTDAADSLNDRLQELDELWAKGTAECAGRDLVVSHEAFGYLADRYGFTQVGITGLSPDAEPSPGTIADVAEFVRENDVGTIYYETLVDPKVARTVAAETGAATAVLDPLEGLAEGSQDDYLTVMRRNLEAVRAGQSCA